MSGEPTMKGVDGKWPKAVSTSGTPKGTSNNGSVRQSLDTSSAAPSKGGGNLATKGLTILYYMGASVLTQTATKAVFTSYHANFPLMLCLAQMCFTALVCGVISGRGMDMSVLIRTLPLGVINCLNILSGLFGTGDLSMPMFIVLRRFTMIFTIILQRTLYGQRQDWQTLSAVAVMITGAVIAALTDLSFNLKGYVALLLNDLLSAAYLVMVKHLPVAQELDTVTLLFYNATVSIPALGAAGWMFGEAQRLMAFAVPGTAAFNLTATTAVCLGLSISHSTYVCTRYNEPLTTSVAGNFKNIGMTIIGMFAFGDYVFEAKNLAGIAVSMAGAVWYAVHKVYAGKSAK